MAQKQFTTYQADILSFELREAMLGIAKPGRYQGWTTMVSNGSPSGGNIPVTFNHGTPGFKKGSHEVPPVLSSPLGIAISTQGTIIHDDTSLNKNIAINGVASIRWDILYMEHVYSDIAGANNAIFGIQQGTAGSGVPTFLNPEKRIIIGLVKIAANGSVFSSLTYYPKQTIDMFGDSNLAQLLWGSTAENILDNIGNNPVNGIIGNRSYTEENYVESTQSITQSIDVLDMRLSDIADRALDLLPGPAPGSQTTNDATINTHGLLPRLPNDATKFLNGVGSWVVNLSKRWVWRDTPTIGDYDKSSFVDRGTSGTFSLSSIVPSDCDMVYVEIILQPIVSPVDDNPTLLFRKASGVGPQIMVSALKVGTTYYPAKETMLLGLASDKSFYFSLYDGTYSDIAVIRLTILAYQTAT